MNYGQAKAVITRPAEITVSSHKPGAGTEAAAMHRGVFRGDTGSMAGETGGTGRDLPLRTP